jgi:hypothetical protein
LSVPYVASLFAGLYYNRIVRGHKKSSLGMRELSAGTIVAVVSHLSGFRLPDLAPLAWGLHASDPVAGLHGADPSAHLDKSYLSGFGQQRE